MRIGIVNGTVWGDDRYSKLKSCGFDCYDFNMFDMRLFVDSLTDKDFDGYFLNQKRLADEAGLTIWQTHGPWEYPPPDRTPEERAKRFELMKLSIHAAALLGAKYWVIHPLIPFGFEDAGTDFAAKTREVNFEFMRKLAEYAKLENITVCLENMPFRDFSLSSPEEIAKIADEINDPFFGMCLDTGHANMCADWGTPAQAVRKFKKHIKTLHVHDNGGRDDEHLLPYFGNIDWEDFKNALRETDFNGVLSLETAPCDKLQSGICEKLSSGILEEMYSLYAKVAKAIADPKQIG